MALLATQQNHECPHFTDEETGRLLVKEHRASEVEGKKMMLYT
jgi:hypothetical protein